MEDFSYKQISKNPNEPVTWPVTLSWIWFFIFIIPAFLSWIPWWFPITILLLRIAFKLLLWIFFITVGIIAFMTVLGYYFLMKLFNK
jgi:hypothetical protein